MRKIRILYSQVGLILQTCSDSVYSDQGSQNAFQNRQSLDGHLVIPKQLELPEHGFWQEVGLLYRDNGRITILQETVHEQVSLDFPAAGSGQIG